MMKRTVQMKILTMKMMAKMEKMKVIEKCKNLLVFFILKILLQVIPKHLLENRILEKLPLVHRLIVVPMKVAMTMKMMTKNNLQIFLPTLINFFSVILKMKNPAKSFLLSFFCSSNQTHKQNKKSRKLCLLYCCFCCLYYSYFLMLLYISSCVPVSWSYSVCTFFFLFGLRFFRKKFIH